MAVCESMENNSIDAEGGDSVEGVTRRKRERRRDSSCVASTFKYLFTLPNFRTSL